MKKKHSFLSPFRSQVIKFIGLLFLGFMVSAMMTTVKAQEARTPVKSETNHSKKVSGRVTDTKGEPLPGVTVAIKGTTTGTITDLNGNYHFNNLPKNAVLQFSFIGMQKMLVVVGNHSVINLTMKETSTALSQVVVVAYGTQQKATITSSVSVVKPDVLKDRPNYTLSTALEGQAAGVNVVQSSGQPGAVASISIRGVGSLQSGTSPLVIIDGVPGSLGMVNPNDVASISILKDAAASALYGSRAANGVILVTTKHAKVNKIAVSYTGYVGYQTPTELFQEANAYNYAKAYNEATMFDLITPTNLTFNTSKEPYTQQQLDDWKSGKSPSTDWRKALFSQSGFTQSHFINVSGGINNNKASLKNDFSFGYMEQLGNVVNTSFNKFTLHNNSDLIWGRFNAELSLGIVSDKTLQPTSLAVGNLYAIINAVNRQSPTEPIKDANGNWNVTATNDTDNPIRQAKEGGSNDAKLYNILLNMNASYTLLDNLVIKFTNGVNYTSNYDNQFLNQLVWSTGMVTGPNKSDMSNYLKIYYMQNLNISYNKTLGKHHFKAIVGGEQEVENYNYMDMTRRNYINNSLGSMQLGSITGLTNYSEGFSWALQSLFGRLNYNYNNKYMLEFDFREDGSSRLSPSKRWGFFPSVSGGWQISKESFMSSLKPVISDLKLRASYGVLGNQELPGSTPNALYYRDASIIGPDPNGWAYVFGDNTINFMALLQSPNNILTWERTAITDIGLDGSLYNQKLTFTFDYFNKETRGILMTKEVSDVNGGGSYVANIGKMKNYGLEVTLGYAQHFSNGIILNLNGNFTAMGNKILNLGGQNLPQRGVYKNTVGYPLNAYYLYVSDGLVTKADFTNPNFKLLPGQLWGDQIIKDVNGDGVINSSDQVMTHKSSTPKYLFAFNFNVSYKGFGISGMLQGAADYYKYLGASVGYGFNSGYSITKWTIENSYNPYTSPDNYNTRLPRLSIDNSINNTYPSTMFLFNSSYVRLKNLQIYYDFQQSLLKRLKIKGLRIYLSGQDLFTISKLPKALGIDPEIGSATGGYPLVKIFTTGLNVSF